MPKYLKEGLEHEAGLKLDKLPRVLVCRGGWGMHAFFNNTILILYLALFCRKEISSRFSRNRIMESGLVSLVTEQDTSSLTMWRVYHKVKIQIEKNWCHN